MDPELEAMQALLVALTPLDPDVRERVIQWAGNRFEVAIAPTKKISAKPVTGEEIDTDDDADPKVENNKSESPAFATLGELFSAAGPKTNGQKALVVGYWLQLREGMTELDAQRINTELKHLGYGIANITTAMDEIKSGKPAMAIQLKKSGTTRQARKKYKVTEAGMKAVDAVLRGEDWK